MKHCADFMPGTSIKYARADTMDVTVRSSIMTVTDGCDTSDYGYCARSFLHRLMSKSLAVSPLPLVDMGTEKRTIDISRFAHRHNNPEATPKSAQRQPKRRTTGLTKREERSAHTLQVGPLNSQYTELTLGGCCTSVHLFTYYLGLHISVHLKSNKHELLIPTKPTSMLR